MVEVDSKNEQVNLKIPKKLKNWAEEYANSHGYTNVQELIRDSLRDKVFSEEIREEYIEKLAKIEQNPQWLSQEENEEFMLALAEKAAEYKNAKK